MTGKRPKKRIILASLSKSRRSSMALLGLNFSAIASNVDEKSVIEKNPERRVLKLAKMKAMAVAGRAKHAVVIGADLIVVFRRKIYEKPSTLAEARAMLRNFSGKKVTVLCGLAAVDSDSGKILSKVKRCKIKFMRLDRWQIENYIRSYPVLSFSGAFDGDAAIMFSEHIDGDAMFYSGIPLSEVYKMLKKLGAI